MDPRLRSLVALLALFAFSAYLAESVRAFVCPPGMEMASAADGGMHHAAPSPGDSHQPAPAGAPSCPLGMASAGGGCAAAALPAVLDVAHPAVVIHEPVLPPAANTHDRLLVVAHFRPPRA